MEIVIVICLLIVIVLLVQDKIVIHKRSQQKPMQQEKVNPKLPDIMGQPKPVRSHSVPNTATERQIEEPEVNPNNLDIEYDENENVGVQIPQEELDEIFSNVPDLEEEEEEWNRSGISGNDDGFAQGVTFEELNNVGFCSKKKN